MSKAHDTHLNRKIILNCVQRHLLESHAELGEMRPLGEMIPRIASELRGISKTNNFATAAVAIIPMPLIAAFVDGDVSTDEDRMICNAVLVDNSVLAEIVAALRVPMEVDDLPLLSNSMTARLLSLQTFELPLNDVANPAISAISAIAQDSVGLKTSFSEWSDRRRQIPMGLAILVSLAASILALFWFGFLKTKSEFANEPSFSIDSKELIDSGSQQTPEPIHQNRSGGNLVIEPNRMPELLKNTMDPIPILPETESKTVKVLESDSTKIASRPQVGEQLESMKPIESTHLLSAISGIRWTKITGLLAQRAVGTEQHKPIGESVWGSVSIGRHEWDLDNEVRPLELRTLPMSRAEASLTSGGKIVLASDTGLQMTRSERDVPGRLDLQHGFVALIDVPKGTILDLCLNGASMATLRWESKATIVLGTTSFGLQAQIDGGEVSIDGTPRRNTAVIIGNGKVIEPKERTVRIPNWVMRPIESVSLPKAILAQIASSENLSNTLNHLMDQQSADGVDENRIALISAWQTSLNSENLFRQANARRPFLRIAALQRIVQTPEWDPRYAAIWSDIELSVGDARKVLFLRNMVHLARQGGKPNSAQVNPLLALLESPDIASRALSDFLLRKFYGGGPVYDPTWTDESNTRGVGLWRRFINAASAAR